MIEDSSTIVTLEKNRFVDDLLGGDETKEEVNLQINGTTSILDRGGFSLKFIVHSGIKPCEKASSDGETVKMLGYKWTTELDLLFPGLGELNLNNKVRESKKKLDPSLFKRRCKEVFEECISFPENNSCQGS